MTEDTSLILTGLRSSLMLDMSAMSGLLRIKSATSAMTGYGIETKTGSDKVAYKVITLDSFKNPTDPPALKLSATYTQDIDMDEVDLDLRFNAIPKGTEIALDASQQALRIPRQVITGKGVVGAPGIDLGTFASDLDLSLWVKDPDNLTTASTLEMSFSKIDNSSGGPVKKILLQKIVINLSAGLNRRNFDMDTTIPDGVITIRNTVGENGNLPRNYSAGSPDIIVSGKLPFEDPSILEKPENYDKSYDNLLYIGLPNFLYVRGKNFGTQKVDGSWNLYWSTPNILLYPYLWESNQLATSDGNQDPAFSLAPKAIGASTNAFLWTPPDTQDHYCMIAVAKSPGHPNPLAGVRDVTSLASAMSNNPNIAQRNLQLIRGNVPQVVSSAAYAQGDEGQTMDIAVLLKNLPKGSSWSAASGTPLNGVTLQHAESNTQVNNFKYAWSDLDVPAQWQTLFSYTMAFGSDWSGIPDGAKPELTIRGEIAMTSEHPLYNHPAARLAEPHPLTGQKRMCKAGNPVKLMIAGTVTTRCPDIERR